MCMYLISHIYLIYYYKVLLLLLSLKMVLDYRNGRPCPPLPPKKNGKEAISSICRKTTKGESLGLASKFPQKSYPNQKRMESPNSVHLASEKENSTPLILCSRMWHR